MNTIEQIKRWLKVRHRAKRISRYNSIRTTAQNESVKEFNMIEFDGYLYITYSDVKVSAPYPQRDYSDATKLLLSLREQFVKDKIKNN